MSSGHRLGIDLGGTKIEGVLLDGAGRELKRHRRPTPKEDYASTLEAVAGVVAFLEGEDPTIGIGTPGSASLATGRMQNCNSTWLNGRPFQKDIEKRLGKPVRVANDANCFALSEAVDGSGAGAHCVFGVILGTGVGGGLVMGGSVWSGPGGIAGEWGHNPLPWPQRGERPGPVCYCGRRGCIETFLSGPGFQRDYASATGAKVTAEEIVGRAKLGEYEAVQAMERYHERLARGLAVVINTLEPDVIVLGGGMSNIESIYETVPGHLSTFVFSDTVHTRLERAKHGDSSGVRGAAWLWN